MNAQTIEIREEEARPLVRGFTLDSEGTYCKESAIQYEQRSVQGITAHVLRMHITDPSPQILNVYNNRVGVWKGGEQRKQNFLEKITRIIIEESPGIFFSRNARAHMSLMPHAVRETLTVELWVNDALELIHGPYIQHTRLVSELRLGFGDLKEQLRLDSGYFPDMIKGLVAFAEKLCAAQVKKGVSTSKKVEHLYAKYHADISEEDFVDLASSVVGEVSVFFNSVLSEYCKKKDVPILYRNVGKKTTKEVVENVATMYKWAQYLPKTLQQLFSSKLISTRSTVKEVEAYECAKESDMFYSTLPVCHAGLRLPQYAAFGAPLRCPVSLINFLQLSAVALDKEMPFSTTDLGGLSNHINAHI